MGRYDYAPGSVYGIVMLPDAEAARGCCDYSRELGGLAPSEIRLGEDTCLPHITVVHVAAGIAAGHRVWDSLRDSLAGSIEVEGMGLGIHRSEEGTVPALVILPSPALLELHRRVREAVRRADQDIVSEHGERYWPHITLAWWRTPPDRFPPLPDLLAARFRASPRLVEMGVHGTVVRTLA